MQGVRRGRGVSQVKQDLRIRRKRGLTPRELTPPSSVDRTEHLHVSSLHKVDEAPVTVTLSPSPPRKQQNNDDAPAVPVVEARFPAEFLSLHREKRHCLFPQLDQLLFPVSRESLARTSTLEIASEAATAHLYNSLLLRERVIGLAKEMKRLDNDAKDATSIRQTVVMTLQMTKTELDDVKKKVD